MFCYKCGNQINEGDMFCGACGASTYQAEQYENINYINYADNDKAFSLKGYYIFNIILLVSEIILWFFKVVDYSMEIEAFDMSKNGACSIFDTSNLIMNIVVLGLLVISILFLLKSVVKNTDIKSICLIMQGFIVLINIFCFFGVVLGVKNMIEENMSVFSSDIFQSSWSINTMGYIYIGVMLLSFILTCIIRNKLKQKHKMY